MFRPSTHLFYPDFNGNGVWNGSIVDRSYNFGITGDKPIAGTRGFGPLYKDVNITFGAPAWALVIRKGSWESLFYLNYFSYSPFLHASCIRYLELLHQQ